MTPHEDPTTGHGAGGSPDVVFADHRCVADSVTRSRAARPRLTLVMMSSTVLVHTKGFGSSFQCDAHTSIAAQACANAAGGPTLCHRSQWTSSRTR